MCLCYLLEWVCFRVVVCLCYLLEWVCFRVVVCLRVGVFYGSRVSLLYISVGVF